MGEEEVTKNKLRYFSKEEYEEEMEEQRMAMKLLKSYKDFGMWKDYLCDIEELSYEEYMDRYNKYMETSVNGDSKQDALTNEKENITQ